MSTTYKIEIPDETHGALVEMDSFQLDREIAFATRMLDEEDTNQLRWLAALLIDKYERTINDTTQSKS